MELVLVCLLFLFGFWLGFILFLFVFLFIQFVLGFSLQGLFRLEAVFFAFYLKVKIRYRKVKKLKNHAHKLPRSRIFLPLGNFFAKRKCPGPLFFRRPSVFRFLLDLLGKKISTQRRYFFARKTKNVKKSGTSHAIDVLSLGYVGKSYLRI